MASRKPAAWLQGKTVKKGGAGSSSNSRTSTPHVQSTSTTIFGGGVKDPSGRTSEFYSMDDVCPVCKSDRYLNPKLRLLVSACYHKMCESCIDRLFTLGPAPCPICNQVLRKLAFTPQTFEDLGVEKEVAIRRRTAKEFNKRREDFDDLRAYNDYLEEVEDIAFNLINDIDVAATEARIAAYRSANAALTAANQQREEAYAAALKEQEEFDRKEREERAAEIKRMEDAEREEILTSKREIIDKLETSQTDARKLVAKSRAAALRRTSARVQESVGPDMSRLLRTRTTKDATIKDEPHVPMQDEWYAYEDLYTLQPQGYNDMYSTAVRKDRDGVMRGGGYMVEQSWDRAIRSAVAGLTLTPLEGSRGTGLPAVGSGGDVVMAS